MSQNIRHFYSWQAFFWSHSWAGPYKPMRSAGRNAGFPYSRTAQAPAVFQPTAAATGVLCFSSQEKVPVAIFSGMQQNRAAFRAWRELHSLQSKWESRLLLHRNKPRLFSGTTWAPCTCTGTSPWTHHCKSSFSLLARTSWYISRCWAVHLLQQATDRMLLNLLWQQLTSIQHFYAGKIIKVTFCYCLFLFQLHSKPK